MKLITVATHSDGYFKAFNESCKRNNLELIVLGWNKKWKGLLWKFNLIQDYLNNLNNLNNDEIVIFTDAYDVLCLEDHDIILKKFKSINKPIVFGIENPLNYKYITKIKNIAFYKCNNHIINSGCYMGYVKNLKDLFTELCKFNKCDNKLNDQKILNIFCNQTSYIKNNVYLDKNGLIFFNAACSKPIKYIYGKCNIGLIIKNNNITNPLTKTSPSFLHGPGSINLDDYCKIFNYPLVEIERNKLLWFFTNYLKEFIILLLIILIISYCILNIVVRVYH